MTILKNKDNLIKELEEKETRWSDMNNRRNQLQNRLSKLEENDLPDIQEKK